METFFFNNKILIPRKHSRGVDLQENAILNKTKFKKFLITSLLLGIFFSIIKVLPLWYFIKCKHLVLHLKAIAYSDLDIISLFSVWFSSVYITFIIFAVKLCFSLILTCLWCEFWQLCYKHHFLIFFYINSFSIS